MSVTLRIESPNDVLDLNGIATNGFGYQALRGANIFGMPAVTTQWIEGAGDGALYRGTRVRMREGDLPLDIVGQTRSQLKSLVSRLAIALSEPCDLVATEEGGAEWFTTVVRSGGGGWQYGIDTVGQTDLQIVVTLTAGDPFWTSRSTSVAKVESSPVGSFLGTMTALPVAPSQAVGSIRIENVGDATAYPVWTITGPGNNFKATSPRGEVLWWTGTLADGQKLTLDTRRGTVVDGTGANRYSLMANAPRFWSVPPGSTTCDVSLLDINANSKVVCTWQARKWAVV